jgi:hypothetical protein
VSSGKISWPAQSAATGFAGAISTAPQGAAGRTTTYQNLGNVTSWTPTTACGETLYYGVASQGPAGAQWTTNELPITGPVCATTSAPPASTTGMVVGLNEAGWGAAGAADVGSAFQYDRLDTADGEPVSDFANAGVKVIALFSGPYNTGGVSALNATTWTNNALSYYASQCEGSTSICPAIEVLNEPGGSWFWGSNAMSTANAAAYASLLKTVHNAFVAQYGANHPLILASYDGGQDSSVTWGQEVWAADPNVGSYVDGVTVHPYGGTGSAAQSALGNRADVTAAHNQTGKPVWVTEVGFPTAVGQSSTGDSLQWTEQQQADNIYNFVTWARSTGNVAGIMWFGYRDYGTNNWYGVERWGDGGSTVDGSKKPGWYSLSEAAKGQSCTVC